MPDNVAGFPPAYEYLKCGRAFVLAVTGQASTYCGVGICDPYLSASFAALAPFRYFRSAFTWIVVAKIISIAAGQTISAFNTGPDENHSGDGLQGPVTFSDANTQTGGVNADRGQVFFASGMTVQAEDPFQYVTSAAGDANTRQLTEFLQPDAGVQGGVHDMLMSDVLNYAAYTFRFGNQGCDFRVGLAKHFPDWGGPSGRALRNGQTAAPGLYLPFTVGICTGAKDEVKQLKMTISIGVSLQVIVPAGAPTPDDTDVKTPILTTLIGYVCCVGDANNCGLPTLTPEEVMVVKNTLRQNPAPQGGLGISSVVAPGGYPNPYGQLPPGYPQR